MNTSIGLLKWRRMPYEIKTASAIFQRAIEQVLGENIKNMVCYQDDKCLGATIEKEFKKKTDIVLNKLRNDNKWKKCVNNSCKISFLGDTISKECISPDQAFIEKILKIAVPTNKKELECFLGLVDFYRRYVPKYTDLTKPLENLKKESGIYLVRDTTKSFW